MEATKEMEMMKDGARRVQAYLEERGITVKHNVMLEALSAGFGSRNWRTVRDKLNGPSEAEPAPVAVGPEERWHVFGEYTDNRQPYHAFYPGHCAQQAQVFAQLDRLFDEYGSHFSPDYAVDRNSGTEAHTYGCDSVDFGCGDHISALKQVVELARKNLGRPPSRGVEAADLWDIRNAILEFLEELVEDDNFISDFDGMDKWTRDEPGFGGNTEFSMTDSRGVEHEGLSGTHMLQVLCEMLSVECVMSEPDVVQTNVYHIQGLVKYASSEVNWVFAQYDL
jgi:hypothetical protein